MLLWPVDSMGMSALLVIAHSMCWKALGIQFGPLEVVNPDPLAPLGNTS
jgi:hypothetical protein